ncbi:MAG: Npun_R1517 family heterocyst differentiation transcriptional regulator [Cyanobacteria bacterium J06626_23]
MASSPTSSLSSQPADDQVGIYECELRLKFRIIEEKLAMSDQDGLVEVLVDAFAYGSDEYLEALESDVKIEEVQALAASPAMRRQLIRLRNSQKLA